MSDKISLADFPTLCDKALDPLLRSHGFRPVERKDDRYYSWLTYADGVRYIEITANVDPRDTPNYCAIGVGEGKREMPECDWNAVPLWRLIQDRAPERVPTSREPYAIATQEALAEVVTRMAADLSEYADDFLRGELTRFRRVRAEQTRAREPYTIWEPGEAGSYVSRPDPVSTALKARFSQAD